MALGSGNLLKNRRGFTVVELLIVIVVIAILAAITVVAYNGVTQQARVAALKSDLRTAATSLSTERMRTKSYPVEGPANTASANFEYSSTAKTFCLTATSPGLEGRVFYTNETGGMGEGECPYIPPAGSMQAFTAAECNALPVFTKTNTAGLRTATDDRGGVTRTYEIAKLADNNCWMLSNLKLGSTTGAITLTPGDSDVASSFTLPQVKITGTTTGSGTGNGYDTPYVYGPVTGDTGSGVTNYGYLYNWSAATAGETRTTKPSGSGDAPNSICPANWRLPTGSATGELAWLNAKMYDPSATAPSTGISAGHYTNWRPAGTFRGSLSGLWNGGFDYQGTLGRLWSASAHPDGSSDAFGLSIVSGGYASVDDFRGRYYGHGVRCLLN